MAELEITSRNYAFDPLRDIAVDRGLPLPPEQDPEVVNRCPGLIRAVVALCIRYSDGPPVIEEGEAMLTTPRVQYRTVGGQCVPMRVGASFPVTDPQRYDSPLDAALEFLDDDGTDEGVWVWLIVVEPDSILRQTATAGARAGSDADVNYFWHIVRAIDTAVPSGGDKPVAEGATGTTRPPAVVTTDPL